MKSRCGTERVVLGLPEKRIQPQRAQATDVELTARVPRSATDSKKVTPVASLQVMGLMGMIPESHTEGHGETRLHLGCTLEKDLKSQSIVGETERTYQRSLPHHIQRHVLGHGYEKRMPLKMWIRILHNTAVLWY